MSGQLDWCCLPLELASVPPPGMVHHYKDAWWLAHPLYGVLLAATVTSPRRFFPQCNSDEQLARKIAATNGYPPGIDVVQIPSVFFATGGDGELRIPATHIVWLPAPAAKQAV